MKPLLTISIVGLSDQGIALGSALSNARDQFFRLGYDSDLRLQQRAQQIGAIDKACLNLHQAVKDAQIIALCGSWADLKATLQTIAPSIKQDSVVIDTSPMKTRVAEWIKSFLPSTVSYIGIYPVEHLWDEAADLKRDKVSPSHLPTYLAAPSGTSPHAIDLVAHLIQSMESQPIFIDPMELDGLLAKSHLLPPLLAYALLQISLNQGGWQENYKLSSFSFAFASSAINAKTPTELVTAWKENHTNTLRALDELIAALNSLRQSVADLSEEDLSPSQHLVDRISQAQEDQQTWWSKRLLGDFQAGVPIPQVEKRSFLSRFSINTQLFNAKRKR